MDTTLTVGMIVWPALGVIGLVVVLSVIYVILKVIGDGFSR